MTVSQKYRFTTFPNYFASKRNQDFVVFHGLYNYTRLVSFVNEIQVASCVVITAGEHLCLL